MTDESSDHADQQRRSIELLDRQRATLAADAAEIAREHPDLQIAGLVLEPEASEARPFREALEAASGQSLAGRGFLGVVPRQMVLEILRANGPAMLDWIESQGDGPRRTLPILVATRDGFRAGSVEYEAEA